MAAARCFIPARPARHGNRLGAEHEPDRNLRCRSECVRVDARSGWKMETDARPAANQPSGDLRQVVPAGEQVRRRIGGEADLRVLLRVGERLVGVEAHQEADPVDDHLAGLASEQRFARGGLVGFQSPRFLGVHQGYREHAGADGLGDEDAARAVDGRVPELVDRRRVDPQR